MSAVLQLPSDQAINKIFFYIFTVEKIFKIFSNSNLRNLSSAGLAGIELVLLVTILAGIGAAAKLAGEVQNLRSNAAGLCGYCSGTACVSCAVGKTSVGECSSNSQCGAQPPPIYNPPPTAIPTNRPPSNPIPTQDCAIFAVRDCLYGYTKASGTNNCTCNQPPPQVIPVCTDKNCSGIECFGGSRCEKTGPGTCSCSSILPPVVLTKPPVVVTPWPTGVSTATMCEKQGGTCIDNKNNSCPEPDIISSANVYCWNAHNNITSYVCCKPYAPPPPITFDCPYGYYDQEGLCKAGIIKISYQKKDSCPNYSACTPHTNRILAPDLGNPTGTTFCQTFTFVPDFLCNLPNPFASFPMGGAVGAILPDIIGLFNNPTPTPVSSGGGGHLTSPIKQQTCQAGQCSDGTNGCKNSGDCCGSTGYRCQDRWFDNKSETCDPVKISFETACGSIIATYSTPIPAPTIYITAAPNYALTPAPPPEIGTMVYNGQNGSYNSLGWCPIVSDNMVNTTTGYANKTWNYCNSGTNGQPNICGTWTYVQYDNVYTFNPSGQYCTPLENVLPINTPPPFPTPDPLVQPYNEFRDVTVEGKACESKYPNQGAAWFESIINNPDKCGTGTFIGDISTDGICEYKIGNSCIWDIPNGYCCK